MLRNLFLLGILFCSAIALAQPTINSTDVSPQVGESFGTRDFDASAVNPGPGGADATWDFSYLIPTSSVSSNIVVPSTTPNGSLFTNAGLAIGRDSAFAYYKSSTSKFEFYGVDLAGNTAVYTDPETHLFFPVTFGGNQVDNFSGKADLTIPTIGSITSFRSGTTEISADGYGTLILPNGFYEDVLRIKLVSQQKDSVRILIFDSVVNTTIESYEWYKAGTHMALLSISKVTTELQPTPIFSGIYYDMNVGVEEIVNTPVDFTLYPSIARDYTTLQYNLLEKQPVRISLVNLIGSEVKILTNSVRQPGFYKDEVQLHGLEPGIYFLKASFGTQAVTRKLVIP